MRSSKLIVGGLTAALGIAAAAGFLINQRRPAANIILVTFDTTRADRIGCYGYSAAETPTLDRLAAEGVVFQRAYASAPLTLPSHATILTGLYPPEHGLRTNGRNALGTEAATLAAILTERGYSTAAFVAAFVLDTKFGLARGFQEYDDDLTGTEHVEDELHRFRPGDRVVDSALAWLAGHRDNPLLCWVHLYDPHHPYDEHRHEFGTRFEGRAYDAEIAFADAQLKRLVDFIDEQGLAERTLIVVVGDHGEGLGDHGEQTHTHMVYNSTLHVPLICRHTGKAIAGRTIEAAVSLADLFPTILEWTETPVPQSISGRSFTAALRGGEIESRTCYGESQAPFVDHGWSPLECVIANGWKYIRTAKPELYNLAVDPVEAKNLIHAEPSQRHKLEELLAALEGGMRIFQAPFARLSSGEIQALQGLGYVGGASDAPTVADAEVLRDIKDMMPFVNRAHEAQELIEQRRYAEAANILSAVLGEVPDFAAGHTSLGICRMELGEIDEAIKCYQQSLELNPDSAATHLNLGLARLHQQDFREAARHLNETLRLTPDSTEAHLRLAVVLRAVGSISEARRHVERALSLEPNSAEALELMGQCAMADGDLEGALKHFDAALQTSATPATVLNQIGIAQARLGRLPAAAASFRQAIQQDSTLAEPHVNLAIALAERREFADAVIEYENALKREPESLTALQNLAWLLATHPDESVRDGERAVELARRACELTKYQHPVALDALAAGYAELNDFSKAVATVQKALELSNDATWAFPPVHRQALKLRQQRYEAGQPFRERYD